jgi:signal transduction histidine kinase
LALVPAAAVSVILPSGSSVSSIVSIAIVALVIINTMMARYELAGSPEQEATAWMVAAIALLIGAQAIDLPVRLLPLANTFGSLYNLMGSFIPLFGMLLVVAALTCLAVVLFGDELFRIDVAVNRAIVYGLISLFVIGGYVLVVGYLSLIFQSSGILWFSLVATGVIAALFQPIHRLVQDFVNRMIYGEREDPYTVISELGRRLETAFASDEVIPTLIKTIRGALKVSYVAITLGNSEDETLPITASEGAPTRIALTLHVVYQNETIGWLYIGPRQGETGFSAADRRLLDEFARQAGAAIHAARQNADLKIARERLVLAQEEERRRIRRDLHDGLGTALAALNMQAGEVQRLMSTDPGNANRRIVELRTGLREAIGDIRRLVYGLRPPALDELGLLGALRSRIGSYESGQPNRPNGRIEDISQPLVLCLEAPEQLPTLPAAVEVAAYRIVEEGLANIVHHAKAKNGLVTISIENQGLRIEVSDDGVGLSQGYRHGVGLHSMQERTVELGGRWSIQSGAGQGTRVSVWLPLPGEQNRGLTWTKQASLS